MLGVVYFAGQISQYNISGQLILHVKFHLCLFKHYAIKHETILLFCTFICYKSLIWKQKWLYLLLWAYASTWHT